MTHASNHNFVPHRHAHSRPLHIATSLACIFITAATRAQQLAFTDATAQANLANVIAGRLCFADLNNDTRPDAIIRAIEAGKPDRYRVFLNTPREPDTANALPFSFIEHDSNLPTPAAGDCLVFADLNNDGNTDAIITRYLDVYKATADAPLRPECTGYMLGKGNANFSEFVAIEAVTPATTAAVAVGDVDLDGLLDLYLGNWYTKYGESNEAFENQLLVQSRDSEIAMTDWTKPGVREFKSLTWLGCDSRGGAPAPDDCAGRPTYGVMILHQFMPPGPPRTREYTDDKLPPAPWLLELNYGRRASRVWRVSHFVSDLEPILLTAGDMHGEPLDPKLPASYQWAFGCCYEDLTPDPIAGDADRSGIYPAWLTERAKTDPRFARESEKPFRTHGNTFDAAVGDIDNDGDFDLFLTEITHAWAGPSSDRSRFIVQNTTRIRDSSGTENVSSRFLVKPELSVDRIPRDPTIRNWNQGDLFAELADFDHDGRLDLLLSSGDYPDDQRLRLYRQQTDGTFADITPYTGLSNEGSQQISLADVDLDGDIDILVGQSFNRLSAAQIAGRTPTVKLYLNQTVERRRERVRTQLPLAGVEQNSLTLILQGDPTRGCTTDALGAIVRVTADLDNDPATPDITQTRQLIGIGGHAGKQHEFLIHVGLGSAITANVEISWPMRDGQCSTSIPGLQPGRHTINQQWDQPDDVPDPNPDAGP